MSGGWTDAQLDALRQIGDAPADEVVGWLYDHDEVEVANELLAGLTWDGQAPLERFPAPLADFLRSASKLPDWADPAMIERGQRLFMRHGVLSLAGLVFSALPNCYLMSTAVKVLGITQQLAFHPYQRVIATAQMVTGVMTPGGLEPGGGGVLAALRVRLLHASIRRLATQMSSRRSSFTTMKAPLFKALDGFRWSPADGLPINQEDAAYTLLTFSIVILDAIKRLGARPSRADELAYLHCWNVVGSLMGVQSELLCQTPEDARALYQQIQARQLGRTAEGVLLTRSLIKALGVAMHSQTLANAVFPMFSRRMVGDANADLLDIDKLGPLSELARALLVGVLYGTELGLSLIAWIPPFGTLEGRMGQWIVDALAAMPAEWDESLYELPEDLRQARAPMSGA